MSNHGGFEDMMLNVIRGCIILVLIAPFGIWKIVEIITWMFSHIKIV